MQVIPNDYLMPYYILEEMVVAIESRNGRRLKKLEDRHSFLIRQIENRDSNVEASFEKVRDQCTDYLVCKNKFTRIAISIVARKLFEDIPLPDLADSSQKYKVRKIERKWNPLTYLD